MHHPAPIAVFVYNRPAHTLRTLEALASNLLAENTSLWIFADGPPTGAAPGLSAAVEEVRSIIRQRKWCGEVEIIESATNRGLADSIVHGVTMLCGRYGRCIVLEDDLETSPGFLPYMNGALDLYENEPSVFQISGFNVRMPFFPPPTGFLRVTTSWGWATWQRAWRHYNPDVAELYRQVTAKGAAAFDLDGFSFHYDELHQNLTGELKTWAVRWYASVFLQNGLALYPAKTLVRNTGFDGSGVNCHNDETQYHRSLPMARSIRLRRIPAVESRCYLHAMQCHFRDTMKLWTGTRLRDRLKRKLKSINPL